MAGEAPPTLTEGEIEVVVDRYRETMIRYEEAAILVEARLRRELRAASVKALLSSRAKHPDEVRAKLLRKRSGSTLPTFAELIRNLNGVLTDLAGVRVIVYDASEEDQVFAMLQSKLPVMDGSAEVKRSSAAYRASHLLVELDESFPRDSIRGTVVEIQVASIASHVFNEIEHDIVYKDHGVAATKSIETSLEETFHTTRLLDTILARLLSERSVSVEEGRAFISSPDQLRHVLEGQAKRPLSGDFVRLFRLLNAAITPLTVAALARLGRAPTVIDAGRAEEAGVEDATAYALGLMPQLGRVFRDDAATWRGPTTELRRAIIGRKG